MFIQNREKGRVPCRGQLGLGAGKLKHRGFDDATRYLLFPDNLLLSRVRFVERNDLDQGARLHRHEEEVIQAPLLLAPSPPQPLRECSCRETDRTANRLLGGLT